jgi:hypothetical protein
VVGDFVHMVTEAVEPVMQGLTGMGEELDGGWRSSRAEIDAGEAGIGGDLLGQAFRGVYDGAGTALRDNADRLPQQVRSTGEAGMAGVTDYVTADARAAGAMPVAGAGGR